MLVCMQVQDYLFKVLKLMSLPVLKINLEIYWCILKKSFLSSLYLYNLLYRLYITYYTYPQLPLDKILLIHALFLYGLVKKSKPLFNLLFLTLQSILLL